MPRVRAPGSPVLALGRGEVSRAGVGAAEETGADEAGVITRADAARSAEGSAGAFGVGVLNEGRLVLQGDLIKDNHAVATGPEGFARGSGIWNGHVFGERPPHLRLDHTRVIGNTLSASPGLPVEGGGLFTAFPVALDHSRIAHNLPDQCFGCKGGS